MAVSDIKVLYYRTDEFGTEIETLELDDILDFNVRTTSNNKNNVCDITLKNSIKKKLSGNIIHKWCDDNGELIFKTPKRLTSGLPLSNLERIQVFARNQTDNSTIVTSDTSEQLIFTGFINKIQCKSEGKITSIKLTLIDGNFIFLNNVGVGYYQYPDQTLDPTTINETNIVVSETLTVDELKGKVLVFVKSGVEYRYTIISNTTDTINVLPTYTISSDGIVDTDTAYIGWTVPSICKDQIDRFKDRNPENTISDKFDFEDADFTTVSSFTSSTITVPDASSYSVNDVIYPLTGSDKGSRYTIKSISSNTITINETTDLTTTGLTNSDDIMVSPLASGIETIRPDGTAYPHIAFSKAFKPLYEWFDELSQVEYTNTPSEYTDINVDLVISKPLSYHINPNNTFYIQALRTETVNNFQVGSDSNTIDIISRDITNKVENSQNFIIYRYYDFDQGEFLDYYYDPLAGTPIVQDAYKPYYSVSNDMLRQAFVNSEIDSEAYGATVNAAWLALSKTPSWWDIDDTTIPTNQAEYESQFKQQANTNCDRRAKSEVNNSGNGRWSGTLTLEFTRFQLNELIQYKDTILGIPQINLRIKDISYTLSQNNLRTTLSVEEDDNDFVKSEV